ncbi:hypothetical protein OPT61_g5619 [Boeremia exigua]|uniref:Uncharacterized protein n=1 Tax=Boeremia exigua TaxID=749465 RepID=A0ACC2I9S9_9PLEO|nr:hypothetical protein OPT61_g5619 [Boeremia exigua]
MVGSAAGGCSVSVGAAAARATVSEGSGPVTVGYVPVQYDWVVTIVGVGNTNTTDVSPYEITRVINARASRNEVELSPDVDIDVIERDAVVSLAVDSNVLLGVVDIMLLELFERGSPGGIRLALETPKLGSEVEVLTKELRLGNVEELLGTVLDAFNDVLLKNTDEGATGHTGTPPVTESGSELDVVGRTISGDDNVEDGAKSREVEVVPKPREVEDGAKLKVEVVFGKIADTLDSVMLLDEVLNARVVVIKDVSTPGETSVEPKDDDDNKFRELLEAVSLSGPGTVAAAVVGEKVIVELAIASDRVFDNVLVPDGSVEDDPEVRLRLSERVVVLALSVELDVGFDRVALLEPDRLVTVKVDLVMDVALEENSENEMLGDTDEDVGKV